MAQRLMNYFLNSESKYNKKRYLSGDVIDGKRWIRPDLGLI